MKTWIKQKRLKIILQAGIFLGFLGFTVRYVLRQSSPMEIVEAIGKTSPIYLSAAAIIMLIYFLGEGINIMRGLLATGSKVNLLQGLNYAFIGFFFSSITPSASGGQPMQLYQMHREGISLGYGSLALLLEFVSYQTVTVVLAAVGLTLQWESISRVMGESMAFLLAGFMFNVMTTLIVYVILFFPQMVNHLRKYTWIEHHFGKIICEYQQGAEFIRSQKMNMFSYYLTTMVQMAAMYSVPYFIYLGYGMGDYHWHEVVLLQAVLYVSVSALPIPGAMGVTESGFSRLFRILFPIELISGAMVLSRGISFYLFVLISGCICSLVFSKGRHDTT